jgi:hypothetical protein
LLLSIGLAFNPMAAQRCNNLLVAAWLLLLNFFIFFTFTVDFLIVRYYYNNHSQISKGITMKKRNINFHNPNWQDVVNNLDLSDRQISEQLAELGTDYNATSVNALRNGRIKEPSYRVGVAFVELLNIDRMRRGKKPIVITDSVTRA